MKPAPTQSAGRRIQMRDWAYNPAPNPLETASAAFWRIIWVAAGTAVVGWVIASVALPYAAWLKVTFLD